MPIPAGFEGFLEKSKQDAARIADVNHARQQQRDALQLLAHMYSSQTNANAYRDRAAQPSSGGFDRAKSDSDRAVLAFQNKLLESDPVQFRERLAAVSPHLATAYDKDPSRRMDYATAAARLATNSVMKPSTEGVFSDPVSASAPQTAQPATAAAPGALGGQGDQLVSFLIQQAMGGGQTKMADLFNPATPGAPAAAPGSWNNPIQNQAAAHQPNIVPGAAVATPGGKRTIINDQTIKNTGDAIPALQTAPAAPAQDPSLTYSADVFKGGPATPGAATGIPPVANPVARRQEPNSVSAINPVARTQEPDSTMSVRDARYAAATPNQQATAKAFEVGQADPLGIRGAVTAALRNSPGAKLLEYGTVKPFQALSNFITNNSTSAQMARQQAAVSAATAKAGRVTNTALDRDRNVTEEMVEDPWHTPRTPPGLRGSYAPRGGL